MTRGRTVLAPDIKFGDEHLFLAKVACFEFKPLICIHSVSLEHNQVPESILQRRTHCVKELFCSSQLPQAL